MDTESLKKHKVLYWILSRIKRCFNWMILPHSSTMLGANMTAVRKEILPVLNQNEPVLEIGSGNRAISGASIKMDLESYPGVNVVGDAHQLPFKNGSFGFIWMGGVIEHIAEPHRVVQEIFRVLRPGGLIYVETPFFQIVHGAPFDYQRFTLPGLEALWERQRFVKVKSGIISGPSAAFAHVLRNYLSILLSFNSDVLFHILYHYVFGWIVLPFKYFDYFLIGHKQAELMPFAVYYLGRKVK